MALLQVIPLGGVGEIGKNCTVVRQDDDIVIVDCGLSFPNEEMLGVDIVIPDFTYLKEHREKIRGVFLTHAHEDHVGALPYFLAEFKVPVFCTEFTAALIRQKLEEKLDRSRIDVRIFKHGDVIEAGALAVEPIRVTHSIPENAAIAVRTMHGILLFTGDFKFDFSPIDGKASDLARFAALGQEGVLALFSDSTNVDRPGWGPSESSVTEGLRAVFKQAEGRVLLTTFASNIHRMQQVYVVAAEMGRKVAVVGRRMEQNLDICTRLGYVRIPEGTRIKFDEMHRYPAHELAVLTTGSQGEPLSALVQMSKGTYGRMQIQSGDTLIYSARPIPGNEAAIWRTINRLFDQGCHVVYDAPNPVHVSGHAYQEELKMMMNLTKPFYVAPVHGEARHQHEYLQMARRMGYPEHRLFTLRDGLPLEFTETTANFGEPVVSGRVLVDSSGTPGVSDEVLRDRYNVANEGIVILTIPIDMTKGALAGDPIISARAFGGNEKALQVASDVLYDKLRDLNRDEIRDTFRVKADAADVVKRVLQKRAGVRPLVVPIVVEV